jgi:outer membrane lipoprotein SlyB
VASEFGYGLKHVRVEAKHENMLTVQVEHKRAIRECEIEKGERERSGWIIGGCVQDLAAAILGIKTGSSLASMSNQTPG